MPAVLHESVGISIASDYSTIPMTIHAALFSPSFLWKEVPRRGGGWPHETVLPHSGKPTPPRFARLPLPEEGARMIFKETLIKSLSFVVRDSHFPHMCRAPLRFPQLSFIPLVPYPLLRGTFSTRGRLWPSLFFFSTYACIRSDNARIPSSKKGGEAAT